MELLSSPNVLIGDPQSLQKRWIPVSEVKISLSKIVATIVARDDEVIITRNGKPVAVLVSAQEHEQWKETQEIKANPEFVREIQEGLKAIQKGTRAKKYSLDKLFEYPKA